MDKICIISKRDEDIINVIEKLGYSCVDVINSNKVSDEINYHSDVLYLKADNNFYISSCQKENFKYIKNKGYKIFEVDNLEKGYKTESYLNFIVNKEFVIKNLKTALNIEFNNKEEILVNQGYTRCSTICINPYAYITEDLNIYKTLTRNRLDCLLIKKGFVKLSGYDYGFIGGASLFIEDEKILLFFGDIEDKEDKANVISFTQKYDITPLFIENKKLVDIGSGIII